MTLFQNGQSIQPNGQIKLIIPCDTTELEGLNLMLLSENGELIVIDYTIAEDHIEFVTDKVGVFMLVKAE